MDDTSSPITDFYRGKSVFLTGGTGFLGHLYLEKLLKVGAKTIYIMLRSKKNMTPSQRLDKLFESPVFEEVKQCNPKFRDHIVPFTGTMDEDELGISKADQKILRENTEIVLHSAADVRFDISLLELVHVNLRGTRNLINLSRTMKNLKVFVYISTAYSHCIYLNIEEQFYDPPIDPDKMIEMADKIKTKNDLLEFEILTSHFIAPWPNTYAFTKALSEELIRRFGEERPVTVVRPSIVISTCRDPLPGWFNNLNGFNGTFVAVAMGLLRMIPCVGDEGPDLTIDLICADVVTNSTFAAIYDTCMKNEHELKTNNTIVKPQVYNVTSGSLNRLTIRESVDKLENLRDKYTPFTALWFPICFFGTNKYKIFVIKYFLEFLPGILIDGYSSLFAKQKRRILPIYRKVKHLEGMVMFFIVREWTFSVKNITRVYDSMTPSDQLMFPCDIRKYTWDDIVEVYFMGAGKYIFPGKDDPKRIEKSQSKAKKLKILHIALISFVCCAAFVLCSYVLFTLTHKYIVNNFDL